MKEKTFDELVIEAADYAEKSTSIPLQGADKDTPYPPEVVRKLLTDAYTNGYMERYSDEKKEKEAGDEGKED